MDLLCLLSGANQTEALELILSHAGYAGVLNVLCTCRRWRHLVTELGGWRRLVERRRKRDARYAQFCRRVGWQGQDLRNADWARLFYAQTDLRESLQRGLVQPGEKYFVGSTVTSCFWQGPYLLCGLASGQIKVWDTSSALQEHRTRVLRILNGHVAKVTALSVLGGHLASGGHDCTLRLWSPTEAEAEAIPSRPIRILNAPGRFVSQLSLTKRHIIGIYDSRRTVHGQTVFGHTFCLWQIGPNYDHIHASEVFEPDGWASCRFGMVSRVHQERVVYALDNVVRVMDAVAGRFVPCADVVTLEPFLKLDCLHVWSGLLVCSTVTGRTTLYDLGGSRGRQRRLRLRSLAPRARLGRLLPAEFGFAAGDLSEKSLVLAHWDDVIRGEECESEDDEDEDVRVDLGTAGSEVDFSQGLLCRRGVMLLDQSMKSLHIFWFRMNSSTPGTSDDSELC